MKKARLLEFATCIAMLWIGAGQARGAEPFHFIVKGDLVSSYVSRGMYQTGPSFQPTLGLGVAGLDFTVWGSTDFNGKSATTGAAQKEIDITLKYHLPRNFAVWVTDYWWYSPNTSRFMSFADHTTGHRFEASVGYTLPVEKFPLTMAWNTLFEGNDYNDNGKRAWSSYVELGYSLKVRKIDVDLTLGFIPYKSEQTYGVDGFAVTNVAAKGTYTVHACSGLDIPIFTKVVVNPKREDAHVILGISLVPTL